MSLNLRIDSFRIKPDTSGTAEPVHVAEDPQDWLRISEKISTKNQSDNGMETLDNTPFPSPIKPKRIAKAEAKKQAALKREIGCKRCSHILSKTDSNQNFANVCDVGLKAVFRSIRRCAIELEEKQETFQDLCFSLQRTGIPSESIIGVATLINAFKTTSNTEKVVGDVTGLNGLAHKVCYKWNREAHQEMVQQPEFQHLLNLPAFARQEILRDFE